MNFRTQLQPSRIRIFWLIVVFASPILLISLFRVSTSEKSMNKSLRVVFPNPRPASSYDPSRIQLAPEYIFLENVFSPLVEMNAKGQISSGIAERYEWLGTEAHFSIRSNLYTVGGKRITARDAALSLKRLLILTGNTHGNLKTILCPNKTIKTLDDTCPGIQAEGNTLVLSPQSGKNAADMRHFLIPMLTAIDFAVIPSDSIDKKTLKIIDYQNTSGPYYVAHDSENGNIVLKANRSHYHYSPEIPQAVELVPANIDDRRDSLSKFKNHEVDFVTTVDRAPVQEMALLATETGVSIHKTMPINTTLANYTPRGRKKYSAEQRWEIAKALKTIFSRYYASWKEYQLTDQYFPLLGEGGLTPDQEETLKQKLNQTKPATNASGLRIRLNGFGNVKEIRKEIEAKLPGAFIEESLQLVAFQTNLSESEMPDVQIGTCDTAFIEDIGLLSFAIASDHLGLSKHEGEVWLADYMATDDKAARLKKMKELHFRALMEPSLVPLVATPYVALARHPWKMELSNFFANNPFWLIKWEH